MLGAQELERNRGEEASTTIILSPVKFKQTTSVDNHWSSSIDFTQRRWKLGGGLVEQHVYAGSRV